MQYRCELELERQWVGLSVKIISIKLPFSNTLSYMDRCKNRKLINISFRSKSDENRDALSALV